MNWHYTTLLAVTGLCITLYHTALQCFTIWSDSQPRQSLEHAVPVSLSPPAPTPSNTLPPGFVLEPDPTPPNEIPITVRLMALNTDKTRSDHIQLEARVKDVIETRPGYTISKDSPFVVYIFAGTTITIPTRNQKVSTYVIVFEQDGRLAGFGNTSLQNIADLEESAAYIANLLDTIFATP